VEIAANRTERDRRLNIGRTPPEERTTGDRRRRQQQQ
jgi:hypothetical protein